MIGFLKGKILSLTHESALIETVSGVGYDVLISGSVYDKICGKKEAEIYTYMQVKEDGINLFGFSSAEEKAMFLKLVSVSGVGPKMGIAVLASLTVNDIAVAIAANDVKRLSAVKGLGKKTAERIILELREKVAAAEISSETSATVARASSGDEDAVVALMALGFTRSESAAAVSRAKAGGAVAIEDIIKSALQGM